MSDKAVCPESTIESAVATVNSASGNRIDTNRLESDVCESTLDSANRRGFIRKTAIVTATAGLAGALLGKNLIPDSFSRTAFCCYVNVNYGVRVNLNGCNNGSALCPGVLFGELGQNSGEGIASARTSGSPNKDGLDFYTGNSKRMSITNSGDVGIGTCAPNVTLCVRGTAAVSDCVIVNGNDNNNGSCLVPGVKFGGGGSGEGIASDRNNTCENLYGLDFYTASSKRMSITNAGKVGIGTSTPCCTLCVQGTIYGSQGVFGCSGVAGRGVQGYSSSEYGVVGETASGYGVYGSASTGIGVIGGSCSIGVEGLANFPGAIPIVAKGAAAQTANLQQWEKGCTIQSVVNKCGWLGIGTNSPQNTLQVNGGVSYAIATKTANYTMVNTDFAILANATSGALIITLPAVTYAGMVVSIKKIDSSKNVVTVSAGSYKIEGKASESLTKQYDSLTLIADGVGTWYELSSAK